MYVLVGSLVAVAATSVTLLRIDEYKDRRRVEGKLIFKGPHVGFGKDADGSKINVVQLGIQLQNNANFPISYIVRNIRTSVDSTIPSSGQMLNWSGEISSGEINLFRDRPINLREPVCEAPGELEFELFYGLKGREKFPIAKKLNISLRYDPQKGVLQHPWLYAVEPIN